jgi:hypothetical protein
MVHLQLFIAHKYLHTTPDVKLFSEITCFDNHVVIFRGGYMFKLRPVRCMSDFASWRTLICIANFDLVIGHIDLILKLGL